MCLFCSPVVVVVVVVVGADFSSAMHVERLGAKLTVVVSPDWQCRESVTNMFLFCKCFLFEVQDHVYVTVIL